MDDPAALTSLAVLAEITRRDLYAYVRRQAHPVTRDEAAAELGISRKLAAFHLDKLAAAGLLVAHAEGGGRQGRIGRPRKVYEPSSVEVAVSIPARRYELAAEILLDAATAEQAARPGDTAVLDAAHRRGRELGEEARSGVRRGPIGPERSLSVVERAAQEYGFEPVRAEPRLVRLRNCPFNRLAEQSRDLICGMNAAFFAGLVDGVGGPVRVALSPWEGHCCVELRA